MRITQSQLIELARAEVERRADDNGLTAAYLIGSIVHDQALLGGSADVDLVLIHPTPPVLEREVVGLSEDVHLDIAHHDRERYAQPRMLRNDPWIGPAVYDPIPLFDPEHFFEWAQASARGQFLRPDHRVARASAFLERSRRLRAGLDGERGWIAPYVRAATDAANGVASLSGQPAAGRRVLSRLRPATEEAGHPEVFHGLLRLLGVDHCGPQHLASWVTAWAKAFDAAQALPTDVDLGPERRAYYLKGFQALLETDEPHFVLATLLETWDRLGALLGSYGEAEDHVPPWDEARATLELSDTEAERRFGELETYLDAVEVALEDWSARQGA